MVRLTTDSYNRSTYSFKKGDSVDFYFSVKRAGVLIDLTGKKTYITIKKYSDSTTYIIELKECANLDTTGYAEYNLIPSYTSSMSSGHYYFEIKHVYALGSEQVIYEGDLNVK